MNKVEELFTILLPQDSHVNDERNFKKKGPQEETRQNGHLSCTRTALYSHEKLIFFIRENDL